MNQVTQTETKRLLQNMLHAPAKSIVDPMAPSSRQLPKSLEIIYERFCSSIDYCTIMAGV